MPAAITTIGMPSSSASATPDRQWVTPAPGTTFTTPTESDERDTPSAMNPALCSSVTRTAVTWSDWCRASYSSMLCVPGMPNARRAPASSSALTTSSEPRSFMAGLMWIARGEA